MIGVFLLPHPGGIGCGMGHFDQHGDASEWERKPPGTLKNPVTGELVSAETALTSVYQDRTYYFASREIRERFKAAPVQYA